MRNVIFIGLNVLATVLPPQVRAETVPSDDAIAAIALPERQLRGMLAGLIFTTKTMAVVAFKIGLPKQCEIAKPAFEITIAETMPEWRANLISAYRTNVPVGVLALAVTQDPVTATKTLVPYRDKIGASMQEVSKPLLIKSAMPVILATVAASSGVDLNNVDVKEMAKLAAAGDPFCGLLPETN